MPITNLINLTTQSHLSSYCGVSKQPLLDWKINNEIKKVSDLKNFINYFKILTSKIDEAIDEIDENHKIKVEDIPLKKVEIISCLDGDVNHLRGSETLVDNMDEIQAYLVNRAETIDSLLKEIILGLFNNDSKYVIELIG